MGDVVLLYDDDYRSGWQRGRVVEALMDKESGQVRQVVVETADKRHYRRGVTKVVPILHMTDGEATMMSEDVEERVNSSAILRCTKKRRRM